jgi:Insertion element 4 transposase N-terminal/Transposase DDE domain
MPFKLQQIPEESKLSHALRLPLLEKYYPRELVAELLSQCHAWEERERKLSQLLIVYYIIALSLFRQFNVTEVFAHLCRALRWLWPDPSLALPSGGALTARRQSLGVTVMRLLFRRCCRPLATPATKGAFALGLRLMAIDGTLDEVPDTPANALHFGRLSSGPNQSAYPQVRCLFLLEVGTHAIIDAVAARCKGSEQALSHCLLRSLESAMLLMSDRNFFSVNWIASVQQRGAQVLCRLAAGLFTQPSRTLSDGSYLVSLPRKGQEPLIVRVIEYDLHPVVAAELALLPPSRSSPLAKPGQKHRLLTTLLDPEKAPALELIQLYHERWEIEVSIDEIKIHQRLCPKPLRSKSPELLYQEFYGLLLAHYAVRACMHEAACRAELDPDRLSFTHALHVLDTACYEFALVEASELPRLRQRLLAELCQSQFLLPTRRLRFCPRVVKRPFSNFRRKHPWHPCYHFKGYRFADLLLI